MPSDENLTVDLDDDGSTWLDRCHGILARLQQSDFLTTDLARYDVECLTEAIAAVIASKLPKRTHI